MNFDDDLASVAELQRGEARVAALAAGWIDATLAGTDWQADAPLRQHIDKLVRARELEPALPSTLHAELRPYQVDGYQWAMRLAGSQTSRLGISACTTATRRGLSGELSASPMCSSAIVVLVSIWIALCAVILENHFKYFVPLLFGDKSRRRSTAPPIVRYRYQWFLFVVLFTICLGDTRGYVERNFVTKY